LDEHAASYIFSTERLIHHAEEGYEMALLRVIDEFFERILNIRYSPLIFLIPPSIVGAIRMLLEDIVHRKDTNSAFFAFHTIVFYILLQMLMTASLSLASGRKAREVSGPVAMGLVLAWLPPLIDLALPAQPGRFYLYLQDFMPFFMSDRLMLGETIAVWAVISGFCAYVWWLTRSLPRTLVGFVLSYLSFQAVGSGWYNLTNLFMDINEQASFANVMSLIGLGFSFVLYSLFNLGSMLPSLRRFNHALPWAVVTMLGARLAGGSWLISIIMSATAFFAFMLVIIANDYFDRHQDAASGEAPRQPESENAVFAIGMQVALLFWLLLFYTDAFVLMLLFFFITAAYHMPQFRLKRYFCANYKIEGASGAAFFLFGLYVNGSLPHGNWVAIMTLLVFGGFSGGSMFKDYKDIEEDRRDRVGTVYTRNMKKGRSLKNIHRFVAFFTSAMLLVPPLWFVYLSRPLWHSLILFVLVPLPALLLLLIKNRRLAVELTMWAFSLYLAALFVLFPAVSEFT